jgi:hypothetical protein
LARSLYASVNLDREPERYDAVAQITNYVFRLKGKLRPPQPNPRPSPAGDMVEGGMQRGRLDATGEVRP